MKIFLLNTVNSVNDYKPLYYFELSDLHTNKVHCLNHFFSQRTGKYSFSYPKGETLFDIISKCGDREITRNVLFRKKKRGF